MREIEFRAWLKNEKMMGEVFDINFEFCEVGFTKESGTINYAKYDDIELLQYTGLKDNNGKEIFEGDILKTNEKVLYIATRVGSGIVLVRKDEYKLPFWVRVYDESLTNKQSIDFCINCMSIIGNIFENGDLLK